MLTAQEIIDRLGGTSVVATECGVVPSNVTYWKKNGIPAAWAKFFADLARRRGVRGFTVERVLSSHPRPAAEKHVPNRTST